MSNNNSDNSIFLSEFKELVDAAEAGDEKALATVTEIMQPFIEDLVPTLQNVQDRFKRQLADLKDLDNFVKLLTVDTFDNAGIGLTADQKKTIENGSIKAKKELIRELAFIDVIKLHEIVSPSIAKHEQLPTAPYLYFANDVMTYTGKGRYLPVSKETNTGVDYSGTRLNNLHKKIEYIELNDKLIVQQTDDRTGDVITLEVQNMNKINSKGAKKALALLLTLWNKQGKPHNIGFNLQELVDRGIANDLANARRWIKAAVNSLQEINIGGSYTVGKGKRKRTVQQETGILFYHLSIKNNYCRVSVNENMKIDFLAVGYTLLPSFSYSLNVNAFDLCEYIFLQARQNTKHIKERGYFNISFRSIREKLGLPFEDYSEYAVEGKKWKPKQYVIDPILKAIKEVQDGSRAANNTDFEITPMYTPNYANLDEFLDGYLKITFKGELLQNILTIGNSYPQLEG